jgi:[ribosomal protein S5]-alanine N-acetyltransferase
LHLGIYEMQWGEIELGTLIIDTMLNHGFNTLGLNKIYAEIYENDINKIDLFNKNKFRKDADLREHYFYKGKFISSFIFSILKSSFQTNLS